jgi:hypothetical protein
METSKANSKAQSAQTVTLYLFTKLFSSVTVQTLQQAQKRKGS